MKLIRFFIDKVFVPLLALLLFSIIASIVSKLFSGDWLQILINIPPLVWVIIGLLVVIWIIIIINHNLTRENKTLKGRLNENRDLVYKDNAYWHRTTNEGPFCSRCKDGDNKNVRMHPIEGTESRWQCPECNTYVYSTQHSPRRNRTPRDPNAW